MRLFLIINVSQNVDNKIHSYNYFNMIQRSLYEYYVINYVCYKQISLPEIKEKCTKIWTRKYRNVKYRIIKIADNCYKIINLSKNTEYYIFGAKFDWCCTCENYSYSRKPCKHINQIEAITEVESCIKQIIIEEVNIDCCTGCESKNIVKNGIRYNKYYNVQRYKCKDCGLRFSHNLGFEGLKLSPEMITSALLMYYTGSSTPAIEQNFAQKGIKISYRTIYNWVIKYNELMDDYLLDLILQIGERWHTDEVWFYSNGERKYLFVMLDYLTRFWLASEIADNKKKRQVNKLYTRSVKTAKKSPSVLTSDAAPAFSTSFGNKFSCEKSDKPCMHISEIHFEHEYANNNVMESFNSTFRDRQKRFRGLRNPEPIIAGMRIHHNFIKPHMGLNKDTPAYRSGIVIKGDDKLLTIIQNVARNR